MPGFDRTGTWIEGAAIRRRKGYQTEVMETEKYRPSDDPEVGYRPLIYAAPSRSFDWGRIIRWLWSRNSS